MRVILVVPIYVLMYISSAMAKNVYLMYKEQRAAASAALPELSELNEKE